MKTIGNASTIELLANENRTAGFDGDTFDAQEFVGEAMIAMSISPIGAGTAAFTLETSHDGTTWVAPSIGLPSGDAAVAVRGDVLFDIGSLRRYIRIKGLVLGGADYYCAAMIIGFKQNR